MKKEKVLLIVAMLVITAFVTEAIAKPKNPKNQQDEGLKPGIDFSGEHYLLNILGKKNIGNGSYDDPDRRSIFVPLEGDTTINMELGFDFRVLDGNGLDGACAFQIPRKQRDFFVYVVALGKPMDGTDVNYTSAWEYDNVTDNWYYKLNESFFIDVHKGKTKWIDITGAFNINLTYFNETSGETGELFNGWLWQVPEEIWEESYYFWDMKGCDRHIQIRFYPH